MEAKKASEHNLPRAVEEKKDKTLQKVFPKWLSRNTRLTFLSFQSADEECFAKELFVQELFSSFQWWSICITCYPNVFTFITTNSNKNKNKNNINTQNQHIYNLVLNDIIIQHQEEHQLAAAVRGRFAERLRNSKTSVGKTINDCQNVIF